VRDEILRTNLVEEEPFDSSTEADSLRVTILIGLSDDKRI